jgi:hypothetical protein
MHGSVFTEFGSLKEDRGLQKVGDNRNLLYLKGYSQVQLGRDLLRRLQYERSEKILKDALVTLKSGLDSPDIELIRERPVKSEIYRTLVEAAELLQDTKMIRSQLAEWKRRFLKMNTASRQ